ncbi:ricin B-like lectin R40G3 [Tanacetum coccineum]|uniref:Ricin B-like lectin R40G3 n=1 Tax=Tanacetum coccineum TaxID=301880 RepID=A0ABQ5I211_9ASTR
MDRHHHNAPQPAAVAVHHVSHQTTHHTPKYTDNKPTVRFYTKAKRDYSLTVRDGKVVLAPTNPSDHHQNKIHTIGIKDETLAQDVNDEEQFSSFALPSTKLLRS